MSKPVKRIVVETIRTSKGLFVAGDEPQEIPAEAETERIDGGAHVVASDGDRVRLCGGRVGLQANA